MVELNHAIQSDGGPEMGSGAASSLAGPFCSGGEGFSCSVICWSSSVVAISLDRAIVETRCEDRWTQFCTAELLNR